MSKKRKLNLLEQFFNRRKNKDVAAQLNKITIFYDNYLDKITGLPFEETMIPGDFTFADFLHSLFISYPEIPKRLPAGRLEFLLNGRRPDTFDALKEGDEVVLTVRDEIKITKDIANPLREEIEAEVLRLIQTYKVDISIERIKEIIFNENSFQDFHAVIDVFSEKINNLDEANQALNVLMKAWNFFPHRTLGGCCPIEKISESQRVNPYVK